MEPMPALDEAPKVPEAKPEASEAGSPPPEATKEAVEQDRLTGLSIVNRTGRHVDSVSKGCVFSLGFCQDDAQGGLGSGGGEADNAAGANPAHPCVLQRQKPPGEGHRFTNGRHLPGVSSKCTVSRVFVSSHRFLECLLRQDNIIVGVLFDTAGEKLGNGEAFLKWRLTDMAQPEPRNMVLHLRWKVGCSWFCLFRRLKKTQDACLNEFSWLATGCPLPV